MGIRSSAQVAIAVTTALVSSSWRLRNATPKAVTA